MVISQAKHEAMKVEMSYTTGNLVPDEQKVSETWRKWFRKGVLPPLSNSLAQYLLFY